LIKEIAVLNVKQGQAQAFEEAMEEAKAIISSMPGFISLAVSPCLDATNQYLLEVVWERLEDHTHGFRGSHDYQRWKALLHHFYEPFPKVEHYAAPIIEA
jgi:heme-degrading monooxygenase HmoA